MENRVVGCRKGLNLFQFLDDYFYQKILIILVFCLFFPGFSGKGQLFALDKADERQDLWVGSSAEIALFSITNVACGGSLSLGFGKGVAIGIKTAFLVDVDGQINTLELNFLFRLYFKGADSCSGLFIQLNGGPALFAKDGSFSVPSEYGSFSAGLSLGWRFHIGRFLFIEPVVRGGYPYIAGGGISVGGRFWN